jgi:DNA-binding response OmpR family regulator
VKLFGWLRSKRIEPEPEDEYIVPNTVTVTPVNRRAHKRIDPRHGTQVLIIDDSETVVSTLDKFLKSANCLTLTAFNAEDGLEVARSEHPHLIFLDVMLPGMNGYSCLRKIRRDADLKRIPVIVMSGSEKAAEYYFGNHSEADDFMKKPFSRQEVFARIERLLDNTRVPRRTANTSVVANAPEALD